MSARIVERKRVFPDLMYGLQGMASRYLFSQGETADHRWRKIEFVRSAGELMAAIDNRYTIVEPDSSGVPCLEYDGDTPLMYVSEPVIIGKPYSDMGVDLVDVYKELRKRMVEQAELRVANRKMAEWWLNQPGILGVTVGGAYMARSMVHEAKSLGAESNMRNIVDRAQAEGKTLPYQVFRSVFDEVEMQFAYGQPVDRGSFESMLEEAWRDYTGYHPKGRQMVSCLMTDKTGLTDNVTSEMQDRTRLESMGNDHVQEYVEPQITEIKLPHTF